MNEAFREAIWLQGLIKSAGVKYKSPTRLLGDNEGSLHLCRKIVFSGRNKHIEVKFNFVKQKIADGQVTVEWIPTDEMIADIMTKPLPRDKFDLFSKGMKLAAIKNK